MKFKVSSFKQYLMHLGAIIVVAIALLVVFFYVYLPHTTNHGETLTLPDLVGMPFNQVDDFLTNRDLRYQVRSDSSYDENYPPLTVLNQHPTPNSQVKINRKVYLTLNAIKPPLVSMPNLVERSLINAENTLEDVGLKTGKINYVPDVAENVVLEQIYDGDNIEPGSFIPKGSKVDLIVGDGYGPTVFEMPDLIGMEYEEVKVLLLGQKLQLGSVLNQEEEPEFTGLIVEQNPEPGSDIRSGQLVDIWIGNLNEIDTLNIGQ